MSRKAEYPTVQIPVDGGLWDVPSEPARPNGMSGNFNTTRVSRPIDGAFILAPSTMAILFGTLFVGFGLIVLGVFVRGILEGNIVVGLPNGFWPAVGAVAGTAFGIFLGIMAFAMSLMLMTQTTRFDRRTGLMTRRVFFRTRSEMPLSDIVAVQCIHAGRASSKGGSYDILQLNLVVATRSAPRICLTTNPDERWIRVTATGPAEFIGVHLVDQIAQTKAIYEANCFKWS